MENYGVMKTVLAMHSWNIELLGKKEKWEEKKNKWRGVAGGGNVESGGKWLREEMLGLEMEWALEEKKGEDHELQDMLSQGQNKLYSFKVGWELGFLTIWQSKSALLALVKSYSWAYFFPSQIDWLSFVGTSHGCWIYFEG